MTDKANRPLILASGSPRRRELLAKMGYTFETCSPDVDEQNRRFTEMSSRWGGMDMKLPEKRTLVLNDKHPLVKWLQGAEDDERTQSVCAQVADLAEMARQPLVADRMVDFLKRSNQLLTELIGK